MIQKSHDDRMLWAQFDALEMGSGWDDTDILKPQIMIESVYGDSHPGSTHLNQMVEQAVYGVYQTGGKPAKYYATDICDGCAQGHDGMNVVLASREAIANMVEVHASALPWDGMILSSSCDKSIPAHLKAAARMDIPAIFMPGGSMRPGPNMTTSLVAGDISLRQKRKDAITEQEVRDYKLTGCPSVGACTFLGTASTMQCMAEALGMTLPGAALVPATMRDILQYARYAGRKIMELVEKNITASQIMTPAAFRNAIIIHSAIGGDIARIDTVVPYTGSYDDVVAQGEQEVKRGFLPELKAMDIDLDRYDTIVLGTPVWWYTCAPATRAFLTAHDLGGKTVYPFATNGGWLGRTLKDVAALCPGADVKPGLDVHFDDTTLRTPDKTIDRWIAAIHD